MKLEPVSSAAAILISLVLAAHTAPPELKPEDLPLVLNPIEMCFDENGRMFVVEMRDYSEMREVHPHLGRIRMLQDTNGDGVFDKATVYADDLPWPTSVMYYDGGIFVAASPDI